MQANIKKRTFREVNEPGGEMVAALEEIAPIDKTFPPRLSWQIKSPPHHVGQGDCANDEGSDGKTHKAESSRCPGRRL